MKTIQIKNEVGSKKIKAVHTPFKDFILFFTQYPALALILIASVIAFLGERLLLDTHHVEITCKPK
mgnify:CR=1 FL=1